MTAPAAPLKNASVSTVLGGGAGRAKTTHGTWVRGFRLGLGLGLGLSVGVRLRVRLRVRVRVRARHGTWSWKVPAPLATG